MQSMIRELEASEFLLKAQKTPMVDVRSPSEYAQGHIAGAQSLALFSDEERAKVGTTYKKVSKEQAVLEGLDFVGPKMRFFVEEAKRFSPKRDILVHCWRGGMRSQSMGWLLSTVGMRVAILKGGYKAYRQYVRQSFSTPYKIVVLGGMTGTGKTEILKELGNLGFQILDLEGLANHMGSAFGGLGRIQPTNEQFENDLFQGMSLLDKNKLIIVEDESRHIGNCQLPTEFYERIKNGQVLKLNLSRALRVKRLVNDYEGISRELLCVAFKNIAERLGGLATKQALESVQAGDYAKATDIALDYYDKTYNYGLTKRNPKQLLDFDLFTDDAKENAHRVAEYLHSTFGSTLEQV